MENQSPENRLINALLKDRKSERRWKVIRSFVWAIIVLLWAFLIFKPTGSTVKGVATDTNKPYVSLVRLNGEIMEGHGFSAKKVAPELNRAFHDRGARGVVIIINSPGGSPVQASIIHDRIEYLKTKYKKKVVVIGEDALASGAYLVATAADKIYVHPDTLTGSIGVVMSGFGFSDAIEKIGVSRRVFTAGKYKDRLDAFKPLNPADTVKIDKVLNQVHQHFIDDVMQSRGEHLKGNREEIFSGDFWTGSTAVKLGLADGTGNTWTILKHEFNVTRYKNYSARPTLLQIILGGAETELHQTLSQESNAHLVAALP